MGVTGGFQWTRDVPVEWEEELAALFPRSERVTWMKLAWMPGWDLGPEFEVQRWVVYEMCPPDWFTSDLRLEALRGPDPRTDGTWRADARVPQHLGGKKWVSYSPVSHLQWTLYQQTGYVPILRWIIQGDTGGHPSELSDVELNFRKTIFGDSYDLPRPGDLPYTDWTSRVGVKLAEHDKLRKWEREMQTPWTDRNLTKNSAGLCVGRDEHALEQQYAAQMLKIMDAEIEDVVRDIPHKYLPEIPVVHGAPTVTHEQQDAMEEHLLTETTHKPYT